MAGIAVQCGQQDVQPTRGDPHAVFQKDIDVGRFIHQPVEAGGCALLDGARPLGQGRKSAERFLQHARLGCIGRVRQQAQAKGQRCIFENAGQRGLQGLHMCSHMHANQDLAMVYRGHGALLLVAHQMVWGAGPMVVALNWKGSPWKTKPGTLILHHSAPAYPLLPDTSFIWMLTSCLAESWVCSDSGMK